MTSLREYLQRRFGKRPGLKRILDNAGWLFVDRLVRILLGMVVTVWLARYLGPSQFGIISYSLALLTICSVIGLLGLKDIVIREVLQDPRSKGVTLGSAAGLMSVGGVGAYLLLVTIVLLTRPDESIVKFASLTIGSSVLLRFLDFGAYWFESQVKSKYVVVAQQAVFIVFSAVKVILIMIGASLDAFIVTILCQFAASSLATAAIFRRFRPSDLRLSFDTARMKSLISESWPLLLSGAAALIYMKIDQLMIASILGDRAVGVYSAAVTISEATFVLSAIVIATVFPAIISARNEGAAAYRARFQQLFDFMVILAIAIALPVTFLSDRIIATLFGSSYQAAGIVLTIHIWASLFVFLGTAGYRWFVAEGRTGLNLQRTLLGAVFNIALNLFWIPKYGLIGAAVATIVAHLVASLLSDLINAETRPLFWMKLAALNVPAAVLRLIRHF